MANNKNLLEGNPATEFSSGREAVENGTKGGKKLGENNRRRRSYKEILDLLQSSPIKKDKTISIQKEVNGNYIAVDVNLIEYLKEKYTNLSEMEINNATLASIKIMELIDYPDAKVAIKAFEVVRDTLGEKPVDKQDISHNGNMAINYSVSSATEAAAIKAKKDRTKIDE